MEVFLNLKIHLQLLVPVPVWTYLGYSHSCLYIEKMLCKLKMNNFLWLTRVVIPRVNHHSKIWRQLNVDSHIRDLLTWGWSPWGHKLVGQHKCSHISLNDWDKFIISYNNNNSFWSTSEVLAWGYCTTNNYFNSRRSILYNNDKKYIT